MLAPHSPLVNGNWHGCSLAPCIAPHDDTRNDPPTRHANDEGRYELAQHAAHGGPRGMRARLGRPRSPGAREAQHHHALRRYGEPPPHAVPLAPSSPARLLTDRLGRTPLGTTQMTSATATSASTATRPRRPTTSTSSRTAARCSPRGTRAAPCAPARAPL
eukprot:COSAG06_NODE_4523_length_4180_cov_3.167606_2_plen_161_part_00